MGEGKALERWRVERMGRRLSIEKGHRQHNITHQPATACMHAHISYQPGLIVFLSQRTTRYRQSTESTLTFALPDRY